MSGDLGKGTSKATIQFGQQVLNANLPGYVQLEAPISTRSPNYNP